MVLITFRGEQNMTTPKNIRAIDLTSVINFNPLHKYNMNWGISGLIYVRAGAGPVGFGYALLERYVQILHLNIEPEPEWSAFICTSADDCDTLIKLANFHRIRILCYLW